KWHFGDGNSSEEQNPTYTYKQSGTYYVCLTVSNIENGCKHVFCREITVK
ncbi:MAG TPA: hypothetical protein DCQ31_14730, partial [Bacteroidales bacterium]|nr:hypothetical protein [Bacteroidales bacterium]